jgi:hypothetical protein
MLNLIHRPHIYLHTYVHTCTAVTLPTLVLGTRTKKIVVLNEHCSEEKVNRQIDRYATFT